MMFLYTATAQKLILRKNRSAFWTLELMLSFQLNKTILTDDMSACRNQHIDAIKAHNTFFFNFCHFGKVKQFLANMSQLF